MVQLEGVAHAPDACHIRPAKLRRVRDTVECAARFNTRARHILVRHQASDRFCPELAFIYAAKDRQSATRRTITRAGNIGFTRRGQYLFSGLSKCGVCGAGFIMAGRNRLACFGAREKGTCSNQLTIRRDEVEARVLKALEEKLLNKELFEEFCDEFTREMARIYRAKVTELATALQEPESRSEATEALRGLVDAIVLTPDPTGETLKSN